MSLPKVKEILDLNLSKEDLENEISKLKRQLFDLRLKRSTRQVFKPHLFKHTQHKLNQLLMLQNLKEKSNLQYINYLRSLVKPLPEIRDLNLKSKLLKKE